MSSQGRTGGAATDKLGRYYTPEPLALAAVSTLPLERWPNVLEPSVGGGSWARAVQLVAGEQNHDLSLELMDIDPGAPGLMGPGADEAAHRRIANCLHVDPLQPPDLVIGNPTYSLSPAEARKQVPWVKFKPLKADGTPRTKPIPVTEIHVRRALHLVAPQRGSLVYLLPQGFLAGLERARFWEQHPARRIQTVGGRASYTGDGSTDSVDYAVIWWDFSFAGPTTWERLEWEPKRKVSAR